LRQETVDWLLQKADGMFPEGIGAPRAFAKDGEPAAKTNQLLENGTLAIEMLFKQRGYDPKKPAEVKAKLGFALDRYEATAYLVTGALHLPRLSQPEAMLIGKRIINIIGTTGTIGTKLVKLRKRGKASAPQVTALLQAPSTLNLTPPPRKSAAPPAPPPAPPLPPPPPAHQVGFSRPAELPAALQEKLFCSSKAGWATLRCKQYEDILASPVATNPVVPLEFELEMKPIIYAAALQRLADAFPELPTVSSEPARASEANSEPCPCGRGRRGLWPWTLQAPGMGFCDYLFCEAGIERRVSWVRASLQLHLPDLRRQPDSDWV
jgi:hypothetical protein